MSTWHKHRDKGGRLSASESSLEQEWDEGYDVLGFTPATGQPAWVGLIIERPQLAPGQIHPTVSGAYVTRFKADPIDTSTGWRVIVSYRIGDPRALDLPPTQRPAIIETNTESVEVPTFVKADGSPWLNTAGDLIVGLVKKKTRIIFSVRKNLPAYPAWLLPYDDACNNDTVIIRGLNIAPHYLLLGDVRLGDLERENVNGIDYLFFPASFTLTYDPDTWQTKVYNRGLYQVDGTEYLPCRDSEGEPVQEPAFLDNAGKQLAYPVNPASIVTIEDWDHDLLPFSALPLT